MARCTKCNADKWSVVERIGALETWRCELCGQEATFHVFDPALEPLLPTDLEAVFRIVGRWTSKPSPKDIAEIQTLFPVLRGLPASKLLRAAIDRSEIELGRFTASEMCELEPRLQQLGMETTRSPIIFK